MKKINYIIWGLDIALYISVAIILGISHNWMAMILALMITMLIIYILCLKVILEKREAELLAKSTKNKCEWFTDIEHQAFRDDENIH